jgi:ribonuclease P protein component
MKEFSLNKTEKLKGIKPVSALFNDHSVAVAFPLKAVYQYKKKTVSSNKVGFSVAKRRINKAHHRNKIKRVLREGFRQQKSLLLVDKENKYEISIMFIYIGEKAIKYPLIQQKMIEVINKINKNIDSEK